MNDLGITGKELRSVSHPLTLQLCPDQERISGI